MAPPRQRLAVHGGVVLVHARDVPLVPQARAEPERQRRAARASLQPTSYAIMTGIRIWNL